MGSMPPGCPLDTYGTIYEKICGNSDGGMLCLIDSVVGLEPLFERMVTLVKEDDWTRVVLKVNIAELCKMSGVTKTSGSEAECATQEEVIAAVIAFLEKYVDSRRALDYIAITDGKGPAHLVKIKETNDELQNEGNIKIWKLQVADLFAYTQDQSLMSGDDSLTLYPIGAGDTVAAGTLAAWQHLFSVRKESGPLQSTSARNLDIRIQESLTDRSKSEELDDVAVAFAFGLACGSASCLQKENSVFDVKDSLNLFEKISISALPFEQ